MSFVRPGMDRTRDTTNRMRSVKVKNMRTHSCDEKAREGTE